MMVQGGDSMDTIDPKVPTYSPTDAVFEDPTTPNYLVLPHELTSVPDQFKRVN